MEVICSLYFGFSPLQLNSYRAALPRILRWRYSYVPHYPSDIGDPFEGNTITNAIRKVSLRGAERRSNLAVISYDNWNASLRSQ
jgi:hypothetical protein